MADEGQEDLVILLPDTPVQSIRDFVNYIYEGGFDATSVHNVLDFISLLSSLGLPLTSLTRVNYQVKDISEKY